MKKNFIGRAAAEAAKVATTTSVVLLLIPSVSKASLCFKRENKKKIKKQIHKPRNITFSNIYDSVFFLISRIFHSFHWSSFAKLRYYCRFFFSLIKWHVLFLVFILFLLIHPICPVYSLVK